MRLVTFEFLKIVTSKRFLITFFLLLGINFAFLTYSGYRESKTSIPYQAYRLLEHDLKGKTNEEKGAFLKKEYERVSGLYLIYTIQNSLKSENPSMRNYGEALREENKELYNQYYEMSKCNQVFKYTKDIYIEQSFLEKMKNDYDKVNHYDKEINAILEEAEILQSIVLFNKTNDNLSLKTITRTATAYKEMLGTPINFEIEKGIEKVTSLSLTDFFVLIMIFLFSSILITEEKEKNLFTIIKSTKNGQSKTIIAKITALFLGVLLVNFIFYGMNFVYYALFVGYGDLSSTLQSLPLFMFSTLKINIFEYLFLFFLTKVLIFFLIGMIMFYFSIHFNHSVTCLISITTLILIDFFLLKTIDVNSSINLFRAFNLIYLVNTNSIYQIYGNLQFGNLLFEKSSILLILQMTFIIFFISLSLFKYLKSMSITLKENRIFSKIRNFKLFKKLGFKSVLAFETYKLLFTNKVLLISLLFLCLLGFNYKNQSFNLSYNEMFYKGYMDVLKGDLTKEKEDRILNIKKEYDEAQAKINEIIKLYEKGEVTFTEASIAQMPYEDILATKNLFSRIEEKYDYIKENPQAKFVYDTGYNKLFRINNKVNENDISILIVTIISLLSLFIMEYKTGFIHILNATVRGRKRTARPKIIVSLLLCSFIYFLSVVFEILNIFKMYGIDNLSSSIISLTYFHDLPSSITILEYLILFLLTKYISYIMLVLLIEFITLKLKNLVYAFTISIIILFIPILLNALNFVKIGFFPFMNLSWIVTHFSSILCLPIVVIIAIFLYNSLLKELE